LENTTSDIKNFLNITKDEIKEFSTFTKLEIFEVAKTFSSIINMAYVLNERMLLKFNFTNLYDSHGNKD
jgi:hypothetical protein